MMLGILSSCESEDDTVVMTATSDLSAKEKTSINAKTSELQGVNLGLAGDFAILTKSGITNVYASAITGNVGTSPITGAALLLTCEEVSGTIFTVDAAGPVACRVTDAPGLTTAVGDMQTAYTDAAGRSNPDFLNLGAGIIGGLTLEPGLYKWGSTLLIPTDITLDGGPNDVWIFQVAGTLAMSSAVRMTLTGGAIANNIFWQVSGAVTLGTTSHFEGTLLGKTSIAVQTGASVNGRLLAQTAVTLQMNTVTLPVEEEVGVTCEKANLGLYGPYTSIYTDSFGEDRFVLLITQDGFYLQIGYGRVTEKEWEFIVYNPYDPNFCNIDIRAWPWNLLPCDNKESCETAFTISAEDAALLIDEASALGLTPLSRTNSKSSTNKSSRNLLNLLNK